MLIFGFRSSSKCLLVESCWRLKRWEERCSFVEKKDRTEEGRKKKNFTSDLYPRGTKQSLKAFIESIPFILLFSSAECVFLLFSILFVAGATMIFWYCCRFFIFISLFPKQRNFSYSCHYFFHLPFRRHNFCSRITSVSWTPTKSANKEWRGTCSRLQGRYEKAWGMKHLKTIWSITPLAGVLNYESSGPWSRTQEATFTYPHDLFSHDVSTVPGGIRMRGEASWSKRLIKLIH